jgi:hypothetical protein
MGKLFSALKVILVQLLVLSIISGIIGCGSGGLPPSDAPTTGTTPGTPTQPPTPGDFTASAAKTTQVNMSWTASTGAASYNICADNVGNGCGINGQHEVLLYPVCSVGYKQRVSADRSGVRHDARHRSADQPRYCFHIAITDQPVLDGPGGWSCRI